MRNGTDKKKLAAVVCAVLVVGFLLFYIASVFLMAWTDSTSDAAEWIAFGLLFLFFAAAIIGVLLALHQRLKEIRGGEEEDAKRY